MNSIPESTKERVRDFLGCGGEGGGTREVAHVYCNPEKDQPLLEDSPSRYESSYIRGEELEKFITSGKIVCLHILSSDVNEELGEYQEAGRAYGLPVNFWIDDWGRIVGSIFLMGNDGNGSPFYTAEMERAE